MPIEFIEQLQSEGMTYKDDTPFGQGIRAVVYWIKSNAIFQHEPAFERIQINRYEWNMLERGIIPPEREKIHYKGEFGNASK